MRGAMRGYYAILDVAQHRHGPDAGAAIADLERYADRLLAAGPCCLQLRAKPLGAAALRDAARAVRARCRAAGVPFCVNDRLDVALRVGADVLHLGQEDLPLADARQVASGAGAWLRIGYSTHSVEQARAAIEGGADYIGFGPIFGTTTKANPDPTVGLQALRAVCGSSPIPVVAIGGITLDTVASVAAAGASAAAVIGAVANAPDPTAAALAVAAAFGGV